MRMFLALLISIVVSSAIAAETPTIKSLFGCTSKVCVISYSRGGERDEFERALDEARRNGVRFVIRGFCAA